MPERDKSAVLGSNGARPKALLPKRFYKAATTREEGDGRVALLLDGKPVRTPGKARLLLPNAALAEAIAAEWRAQGERIDPETMPLTKLANSVIDGVKGREDAVIDDILGYADTDLVCYRAGAPQGLVRLQRKHWDPVADWARTDLGAPLALAEGVMHVAQPKGSLDQIRKRLAAFDAWSLAALHVLTGLSGSALLALAVALGRLSAEDAWAAAHVDEDWQISQWGEDEEASERRARRHRDFTAAAKMLSLLEKR
jgi:chaperone required for assembly of F1-ATPase